MQCGGLHVFHNPNEGDDSLQRRCTNHCGGLLDGDRRDRVEGIAMLLTSNAYRDASNARGCASSAIPDEGNAIPGEGDAVLNAWREVRGASRSFRRSSRLARSGRRARRLEANSGFVRQGRACLKQIQNLWSKGTPDRGKSGICQAGAEFLKQDVARLRQARRLRGGRPRHGVCCKAPISA
jgi:hypothetical protein